MISTMRAVIKKILGPKLSSKAGIILRCSKSLLFRYLELEKVGILPKYFKSLLFCYKALELCQIRIEVSSVCNLRCVYCPTGTNYNSISHCLMKKDTFKAIVQQIKDIPSIYSATMYIGGEPLLHKELTDMMTELFENTHIRIISIVTNGMLLDQSKVIEISKIAGDINIEISIDGRSPAENNKFRIGSDYETIKNNVINARKKLSKNVSIMITNVIIANNSELFCQPQIPRFLLNDFEEVLSGKYGFFAIQTIFAQTWPGLTSNFIKVKVKQRRFCHFPFREVSIRANGDLILCCYDLMGDMTMGNITDGSIQSQLNSKKYREVRKAHIKSVFGDLSRLPDMCKSCVIITGELITKSDGSGRRLIG